MDLSSYLDERKLTPEGFSDQLGEGSSVRGILKWMSGERTPRPELQRRILEVTSGKVTPTDFMRVRLDWEAKQRAKQVAA